VKIVQRGPIAGSTISLKWRGGGQKGAMVHRAA
jgi:hypothetical protein